MLTDQAHGTQTAVISTEHTLATVTAGKTLVLLVDTSNMAAGDTVELRAKTKVLTGGTVRVAYFVSYVDAQPADDVVKISVPIPALFSGVFTLKQTAGTGRNFDWSVLSID